MSEALQPSWTACYLIAGSLARVRAGSYRAHFFGTWRTALGSYRLRRDLHRSDVSSKRHPRHCKDCQFTDCHGVYTKGMPFQLIPASTGM